MAEIMKRQGNRYDRKREVFLHKAKMYKDVAINAIEDVSEYDSKVLQYNDKYLNELVQADKPEYEILKENMEKAETEEERQIIRNRMAEMKKERYQKDTENKAFFEKQQTHHKNFNLQVLGSLAIVTGLVVKFRKPIINVGKKLITRD